MSNLWRSVDNLITCRFLLRGLGRTASLNNEFYDTLIKHQFYSKQRNVSVIPKICSIVHTDKPIYVTYIAALYVIDNFLSILIGFMIGGHSLLKVHYFCTFINGKYFYHVSADKTCCDL